MQLSVSLKTVSMAAAALCMGLVSMPACAGTIDFSEYAAGREGGIETNSSITFNTGDTLRFISGHGLNLDGTSDQFDFFPYFDDADQGKPAGLGVCRVLKGAADIGEPGAPCLIASDDSIDGASGLGEGIGFFINEGTGGFDLRGLSFRDGHHNDLNDSTGMLRVVWHVVGAAGTNGLDMTFAQAVAMAAAGGFGTIDAIAFGYLDTNFYVQSISDVPIPGAIVLLLSGLGGIGFFSRKEKKTNRIL